MRTDHASHDEATAAALARHTAEPTDAHALVHSPAPSRRRPARHRLHHLQPGRPQRLRHRLPVAGAGEHENPHGPRP